MSAFKDFDVASIVAYAEACTLTRVEGYFKGAADKWLQIWDARSAAHAAELEDGGAVPLKEYALQAQFVFSWDFSVKPLDMTYGCVVLVSDTEGTITISASKMDVQGDVSATTGIPLGTTVAGDLTSEVTALEVWAESAGPKKLYRLEVINLEATDFFVMIFAHDDPDGNETPNQVFELPASETVVLEFGSSGFLPQEITASGLKQGCTVVISADAENLSESTGAHSIRATYK